MTIDFHCIGCGNAFHVPESLAGTRARCNRCGTIVTIPAHVGNAYAQDPSDGLIPMASYASPNKPDWNGAPVASGPADSGLSPQAWIAIGVGGAVVFCLLIGILITAMFSRSGPEAVIAPSSLAPAETASRASSSAALPQSASRPAPSTSTRSAPTSPNPWADRPSTPSTEAPRSASWGEAPPSSPATAPASAPTGASTSPAASWGSDSGSGKASAAGIPYDGHAAVTYGSTGCPRVVVGREVYDLSNQRLIVELDGEYRERDGLNVLSQDGRWFAAPLASRGDDGEAIGVWSTDSGTRVSEVPCDPERRVSAMMFSLSRYLICACQGSSDMQVWEAQTGGSLKAIPTPSSNLDRGKFAFTDDGEYYAVVARDRLVVNKTKTGKLAAVMGAPRAMERSPGGQTLVFENGRVVADSRRIDPSDAVFVYAWLAAIQFSPDSQELAAVSTHPRPRLICWDNHGKLELDEPLDKVPELSISDCTLQWLPDRSGWIIAGSLFDRAAERVVFTVRTGFAEDCFLHALDRDRLIGVFPHNRAALEVIQVPWEAIQQSLELMRSGTPAILGPGQPVSVNVELSGLRGDHQQTLEGITQAMTARLARDEIPVQPNQPTYFRLSFAEAAGDALPIYERQSPFDFRGRDTGRTAVEAKGSLVVELWTEGETEPLWRETIRSTSSRSFRDEVNDSTVRASMLSSLVHRIGELGFPYFVPRSREHLALPVVMQ